ncbi:Fpg/Nei family DNA glycosylase [Rothia sp. AR01]|uniref:DNA-(apurinic or apyrimidinic site) lyase n=1 Tax=Rothia santali TaxID=2949643 RepID=A0A9X2HCJ5_9MICC|nr:DNA-formamidopyrimidine glycosylase family protein [Rothia santali]MCP3425775.1 Fpg/Nei family DNA glycosylase [Rothia santali]
MPEGHSVRRVAIKFGDNFVGETLAVSSPQGRFGRGAALVDGERAVRSYAHGKHFFLEFENKLTMNVHLGMYGSWTFGGDEQFIQASSIGAPRRIGEQESGDGEDDAAGYLEPPAPRATTRVRLVSRHGYADLVGATICRVLEPAGVAALRSQLGPDPLDPEADPEPFYDACARTSRPIGAVLMDQKAIAGIGNIFRAESLFRAAQNPYAPARHVPAETLRMLWRDNVTLMNIGVELGRIVTTAPEHRPGIPAQRAWREHANYVYLRHGRDCRVCGRDTIVVEDLGGRKLYWCTVCQAGDDAARAA